MIHLCLSSHFYFFMPFMEGARNGESLDQSWPSSGNRKENPVICAWSRDLTGEFSFSFRMAALPFACYFPQPSSTLATPVILIIFFLHDGDTNMRWKRDICVAIHSTKSCLLFVSHYNVDSRGLGLLGFGLMQFE